MNLRFSYFETIINIDNEKIQTLEIENKGSFYRCVSDFVHIGNGEILEDIYCFGNNNEEIILANKITVISDYFNFDIVFKKYSNVISKFIVNECDELTNNKLTSDYKKLKRDFLSFLNQIDLPIIINEDFSVELLIKLLKPNISASNNLLNNLLMLIEMEKTFHLNKILIFINLKQYLSKTELMEFYKYAIYNKINILLLDSQSYGTTLEFEQKLIIDENLDEIVL